jgi:hypothetical protein
MVDAPQDRRHRSQWRRSTSVAADRFQRCALTGRTGVDELDHDRSDCRDPIAIVADRMDGRIANRQQQQ